MSGLSASEPVAAVPALPRLAAKPRVGFSYVGIFVFGAASLVCLFLTWFVPSARLWGPAVSGAAAWALFAAHVVMTRRYLGSFDPGIWIAVNMLLNYFGMVVAVDLLAGKGLSYDPFNLGTPPQLERSFLVAILTLVAFLFGMHLAGWMRAEDPPRPWPAGARSIAGASWAVLLLGWLMIGIGVPIAGADVVFGAYGDMKLAQKFGTSDLRFFATGIIIIQCGIFGLIAAHERERPWRLRAGLLSFAILALLRTSVGDRGGLAVLAMGGGWIFTQHVRQVRHWIAVVGFIVAFLVMPIIGEFRENRAVSDTVDLPLSELAAAAFHNMGSSLIAFSYTIDNVPERKGYDLGLSIVAQLIDNIPNVGFSPGRAFGLDTLEHNPSKWLVATANPSKWRSAAGGYGYAMGAEWWFNFGALGVFLGMAGLGYLMGRVRNASRATPLTLVFAALLYVMLVGWVRNDFGYPFRLLIWPLIALLFFQVVLPRRRHRGPAA